MNVPLRIGHLDDDLDASLAALRADDAPVARSRAIVEAASSLRDDA